MAYIGNNLNNDISINQYEYTATAGQSTFYCTYEKGVDVYINGMLLSKTDFSATTGTSVTLNVPCTDGQLVTINCFKSQMFGRSSTTKQTYTATTGQTAFAIQYDIGFVNVYVNGVRLQDGADFAATTGSGITLTIPAVAGDIVQCESFGTFDVANTYTKAENNTLLDLKANSTDVNSALDLKANLASPTFTGTPTAPTASTGDSSTKIATTQFVKNERMSSAQMPVGSVLQVQAHIQKTQFTLSTSAETEIMTVSFTAKTTNPKVLIEVLVWGGFADNPNSNEMNLWLKKGSTYLNVATGQYVTSNTFFSIDADYQYNTTNTESSRYQFGRYYTTAFEHFTDVAVGDTVTIKVYAGARIGTTYINRVGAATGAAGAVSSLVVTEIVGA
jgi:hypothetical protein